MKITALWSERVFFSFVFQRLSHKNENWTFLKMSKSVKNSREFEKNNRSFQNIYIHILYYEIACFEGLWIRLDFE